MTEGNSEYDTRLERFVSAARPRGMSRPTTAPAVQLVILSGKEHTVAQGCDIVEVEREGHTLAYVKSPHTGNVAAFVDGRPLRVSEQMSIALSNRYFSGSTTS